ncbi:MAG: choice-of-anchor E domain-containing protein [Phycisphaerae bacterium]|nr:choice-of-anchor E domain-containing protein [Phycisphaerae bacterium]
MATVMGLAALALVGFGTSVASADVITQTMTVGSNYPPNHYVQTFNKFDTHGGTWVLDSVTITTVLETWGGYYAVDNDNTSATSGEAYRGVSATIGSPDARLAPVLTSLLATTSKTFNLAGTVGDPVGAYNAPPVSGADWDSLSGPAYAGRVIVTSGPVVASFPGDFAGTGTFDVSYDNLQYVNFSGLGNLWSESGAAQSAGKVEIVYNYTVTPEPVTMAFLAMGGIGLLAARRRKTA